jgi:hypothetical protein
MKGAVVIEVAGQDLAGARAALARAVAQGALGPGRTVRRDGDGCVFDDGRLDVTPDGRVTWELSLGRLASVRAVEAAVLAAAVSVAATLGWSLIVYAALGTGALFGAVYAVARIANDRATVRRRMRALVASLPVLVDARRQ